MYVYVYMFHMCIHRWICLLHIRCIDVKFRVLPYLQVLLNGFMAISMGSRPGSDHCMMLLSTCH